MTLVSSLFIVCLKLFSETCLVPEALLRATHLFPLSYNLKNHKEEFLRARMWSQIPMGWFV